MHYRRAVVVAMLAMSGLLTGCGGTLVTGGLPTATPGIASQAGATSAPAAPASTAVAATTQVGAVDPVASTAQAAVPEATAPAPAPAPAASPTINPALANVQLPAAADLQERWRQMQVERSSFDPPRTYSSPSFELVWWFDPLFGQMVPIGELRGDFTVQATFRIRGNWAPALEIPYHVNQQYGFTVPESIRQRMQNAGRGEWAEVFVYQTQDIQPK